ncbi:glycosyl hydrolase family 95 catalytic domain-containing protein [Cohnella zeiphila]|uniref:Glycoside hydrolase family 95 protein n=1 Tax=Cohnella zeiphila TaxID=2761120 RepID=A0A7X0VV66_9BACL|nr:glycoside hydrolase family 95 protein [Cohnella zeiphila]MBB6731032.1 glycoside hydrolase family 95 protein [Cohnella zeiphila]
MDRANSTLWYRRPAAEWEEALPIGNGRLGGMVYGGIKRERIQLNEDTLWSGRPTDGNNAEALRYLRQARDLVFRGEYAEAQKLIEHRMLGPWNESYQSMGHLEIELGHGEDARDYRRELDLNEAVCRVRYSHRGVVYTRETFVSAEDQVMVVRLTADRPGKLSLEAALNSPLTYRVGPKDNDGLVLAGQAPDHVEPNFIQADETVRYRNGEGMKFEVHLQALNKGGRLETHGGRIVVRDADRVTFLLTAATSYNGFDKDPVKEGKDPGETCRSRLSEAVQIPYAELRSRHAKEYRRYFERVTFELEAPGRSDLPTDERIAALAAGGADEQLAALFFQYGRYLLISSSRPGTQPATLQGIWNGMTRPPWTCNYTANINVQMNYWPAETCNLSEFHTPLFDMIGELAVTGARTAKVHYDCGGWVSHHGIDLWRSATPSGGPTKGSASWAFWPMAGPWLCRHLWEHYLFGGDRTFLAERAYPLMKGAAQFCLDWLVEDGQGRLVTNPSTSPENSFIGPDGRKAAVTMGSTMDLTMIRELFGHCIEASHILGIDDAFRRSLEEARAKLPPPRIGRHGQLQEWLEDFEEAEPGHRHTAHLYGLHPGREITPRGQPDLAQACRVTLERRARYEGEDTIGWCFAWLINLYARLEDGETAHRYLTKLLKNPFPNLLNAHRHPKLVFYPTTLEANYGATAGMAELLLQSHDGELHLLPALPEAWPSGKIAGLRARGGFEVEMEWAEGRLTRARIRSTLGGTCRVRCRTPVRPANLPDTEFERSSGGVIAFATLAGDTCEITSF